MAGFFDKMLDAMKLGDEDYDEYDDDFDYEDDDEEEYEEKPRKSLFSRKNDDDDDDIDDEPVKVVPKKEAKSSKITPMRSSRRNNSSMEVCVVKPQNFDDSKEILETLISGKTVILNIEGLDLGLAQRIIDVTSGACYAIDGTLQKVSTYIFLIVPSNVDVSGDFASALMDSMDFSGLQSGL